MNIYIAMPVYEDWESALEVCQRIDTLFAQTTLVRARILLVDDGSQVVLPPDRINFPMSAVEEITVLPLLRNVGHQRAICIAIAYLEHVATGDAVVIMDSDGEDMPEQIPLLLDAMVRENRPTAIFAERGKRLESPLFRVGYRCYRILHQVLTGRDIRFGNFSILPWAQLRSLVLMPELWNHYAAGFLKARLPYKRVVANRGRRLHGASHMNYISLVTHGVSALFAHQELVGGRVLTMMVAAALAVSALVVLVLVIQISTGAIPLWAIVALAALVVLAGNAFLIVVLLTALVMSNRNSLGFIPKRDYALFAGEPFTIHPK